MSSSGPPSKPDTKVRTRASRDERAVADTGCADVAVWTSMRDSSGRQNIDILFDIYRKDE